MLCVNNSGHLTSTNLYTDLRPYLLTYLEHREIFKNILWNISQNISRQNFQEPSQHYVCGPAIWNSLLPNIQTIASYRAYYSFRSPLNVHLFRKAFCIISA